MIRKFQLSDLDEVLNLFHLNTPKYFHPEEEKDLLNYLRNEREDYFVFTIDENIVAAGGINYKANENTAVISWDFVHPQQQGKGIGRKLTKYRLEHIRTQGNCNICLVRTSQFVNTFYEKMGFTLVSIHEDYWAKGYDMYLMENKLII